jgi:hypothetical protein
LEIFTKIFEAGESLILMFKIEEHKDLSVINLHNLIGEFEIDQKYSNQTRHKKSILNCFRNITNRDNTKHSVKVKKCCIVSRRRGISYRQ